MSGARAGITGALLCAGTLLVWTFVGCASAGSGDAIDGGGGGGGGGDDSVPTPPDAPRIVTGLLQCDARAISVGEKGVCTVGPHGAALLAETAEGLSLAASVYAPLGESPRIVQAGSFVHVAAGDLGYHLFSISSDAWMRRLNTFYASGASFADVAVNGASVYLADAEFGLRVISIENWSALQTLGTYKASGARSVALAPDSERVYLGTETGELIALSDSNGHYTLLGAVTLAEDQAVSRVWSDGFTVYAVLDAVGLVIVNATVPGRMEELARLELDGLKDLERDGSLLYGLRAPEESAEEILTIDAADPLAPTVTSALPLEGASGLAWGAGGLYVARGGRGSLRLAADETGVLTADLEYADLTGVRRVAAEDATVCAGAAEGLVVWDVTSWRSPTELAREATEGPVTHVAVDRSLVCAVDGGSAQGEESLLVLTVTRDPACELASRTPIAGLEAVAIDGERAYLACGPAGLLIVNLADPAAPTAAGSLALVHSADCVALSGDAVYLADSASGLLSVVDVGSDAGPTLVGTLPLPAPPESLRAMGGRLLASAGESGLLLYDLAQPLSPEALATTVFADPARAAVLDQGAAMVAAGATGVPIVWLEEPTAPAHYGTLDTPGEAVGIDAGNSLLFVADGSALLIAER